jgi:hypothetical protein
MTVHCGVDFHARKQKVCYYDTAEGEIQLGQLSHQEDDDRAFYPRFTGEVIVGLEAGGYSTRFLELVEGLGHRVLVGGAAGVRRLARRRQKNDRRDAGLILDLLLKGEFPQVYRPPFGSREVLRMLRHRHKLVQVRTRAKNSVQALAFGAGSAGRSSLLSREGREQFLQLPMSEAMARQRAEWPSPVDELNARIKGLDAWLDERAKRDGPAHRHVTDDQARKPRRDESRAAQRLQAPDVHAAFPTPASQKHKLDLRALSEEYLAPLGGHAWFGQGAVTAPGHEIGEAKSSLLEQRLAGTVDALKWKGAGLDNAIVGRSHITSLASAYWRKQTLPEEPNPDRDR